MSRHVHFDGTSQEIRCDGGGWTGCASVIEGGIGDRMKDIRHWASDKGWKRVKDDTGTYLDLCPACSMNLAGGRARG